DAVDSTAAGDSFFGAFLHGLLQNDFEKIEELSPAQILSAVGLAQAAAAITVTRKGSIPALPTAEEVAAFLK
ncbi:MAG: carbohydrate kinase, partial [Oscillospiraceae bacterium]|nr:carbohydrate kinase [Oscillospiraceae bacterium]